MADEVRFSDAALANIAAPRKRWTADQVAIFEHDYMRAAGRAAAEQGLSANDPMLESAARVMCQGDPREVIADRMAFLMWIAERKRSETEDRLDVARYHLRRAVRPLFEAFASKASIDAEARRSALPWHLVVPVLIDEAARIRAHARRRRAA